MRQRVGASEKRKARGWFAQVERGGELLGEILVVLLLLGIEAHILEEQRLPILEGVHGRGGLIADAVLGDLDLLAEQLSQALGNGSEGVPVPVKTEAEP